MSRFYAKKADDNQSGILNELWEMGISAVSIHRVGEGVPDILVGFRGETYIFEVKNPERDWKLTDDEAEFAETWRGQLDVAEYTEDVLKRIGANG